MDKEKLIPIIIQTVQDAVRKDKLGNSKVSLAKQDIFLIFYQKLRFFQILISNGSSGAVVRPQYSVKRLRLFDGHFLRIRHRVVKRHKSLGTPHYDLRTFQCRFEMRILSVSICKYRKK